MVSKSVMVIKIASAFWCKNIYALSNKNVSILFFWLINNRTKIMFPLYKWYTTTRSHTTVLIYLNVCPELLVSIYYLLFRRFPFHCRSKHEPYSSKHININTSLWGHTRLIILKTEGRFLLIQATYYQEARPVTDLYFVTANFPIWSKYFRESKYSRRIRYYELDVTYADICQTIKGSQEAVIRTLTMPNLIRRHCLWKLERENLLIKKAAVAVHTPHVIGTLDRK